MESQSQNPEFRNNPENFHPCNWNSHGIQGQPRIIVPKLLCFFFQIWTFIVDKKIFKVFPFCCSSKAKKKICVVQVTRPTLNFYPLS